MILIIKFSGHRGYNSKAIENTKASFLKAIDEKLDYIEVDIRITLDKKPVIFHDKKVNRLLEKKRGKIKHFSLKELKSFQYKDGQKILSLEELFSLVKGKIKVILDLKVKRSEFVIIDLIRKYGLEKQVIIQSKSGDIINTCYGIAPDIDYALYKAFLGKIGTFGKFFNLNKYIATIFYNVKVSSFPIKYINIDGPFLYDDLASIINENGIKIILGALRTERYLRYVDKWNVEIINSDNPGKIKQYLNYYYKNGLII